MTKHSAVEAGGPSGVRGGCLCGWTTPFYTDDDRVERATLEANAHVLSAKQEIAEPDTCTSSSP